MRSGFTGNEIDTAPLGSTAPLPPTLRRWSANSVVDSTVAPTTTVSGHRGKTDGESPKSCQGFPVRTLVPLGRLALACQGRGDRLGADAQFEVHLDLVARLEPAEDRRG